MGTETTAAFGPSEGLKTVEVAWSSCRSLAKLENPRPPVVPSEKVGLGVPGEGLTLRRYDWRCRERNLLAMASNLDGRWPVFSVHERAPDPSGIRHWALLGKRTMIVGLFSLTPLSDFWDECLFRGGC